MSKAEQRRVEVPFQRHVELLQSFLAHRDEIVERVQNALNAQRKPAHYLQDARLLARELEDCVFAAAGPSAEPLRRQLDDAHLASGFKPRQAPGEPNDLIDPAELMTRAFFLWQRTRWPGHDGRTRYAHTLFGLYVLRRLMLLAMRIWDGDAARAAERLAQLQAVLDELWRTAPADQPRFVRDAHSLFALAQSPTTEELHGYFEVAQRIAETLSQHDRVAIDKAAVRMAGGHLRSQLRHVATQRGVTLDEHSLVLSTRRSNALDLATLVQALVPLLESYEQAVQRGDAEQRLDLADAICQGISPDPELFLNRVDLLRPYSMIEPLFIAAADGRAAYTPMGERHRRLLDEYAQRIARAAKPLHEDCARFSPRDGAYSPYGVLYGFSSQLLEHMGLKAVQPEAPTRFSLEDVFTSGDADKLAWVNGWRRLPHVPRDVSKLFEYPQPFAAEVFRRIESALRAHVGQENAARRANGRLLVVPQQNGGVAATADLPARYFVSSDRHWCAAHHVPAAEEAQLLHSRTEGELLVCYATSAGWVGVTKDVLTDVLGAGRDAQLGLPPAAARVLQLMCPELVSVAERASP
ncbi:MAG TPA: hypothetical protein VM692_05725 [Gammaproteobacteria bacterium]|nr:hypothetical protein [Gammaproteobacteria bacterium]